MNDAWSWLRSWLAPLGLVGLALVLTVPWSYLVILAAYDRDISENARSVAKRLEQPLIMKIARAEGMGFNTWNLNPRLVTEDPDLARSIVVEMNADPSIQTAAFYFVSYEIDAKGRPIEAKDVGVLTPPSRAPRKGIIITAEQLNKLTEGEMKGKDDDSYRFLLPWRVDGKVRAVTFLELSRESLTNEFWKKEGSLLRKVITWTATATLVLSAIGIFAYRSWQRAGHVERSAELTRQGLLAELGLTAAVLAHEIRNPLAALRFQLHSLRKKADNPEEVTNTAQTIDAELLRIQQLVTDYLAHEKAASLRVQSVDLGDAARKLKALLDELLRSTDTRLTVVAPTHPGVHVMCDPHALRQILMNLVLNAQQAMGEGGAIALAISKDAEGYGLIDVTDTGPGIPEEMKARLFKPFQTSKKEGHGIGLALVKRFVDNFGGSVSVDSEAGKGTTFHLRLPLSDVHVIDNSKTAEDSPAMIR